MKNTEKENNSRKMGNRRKEEVYVTVPSLFRCPISLDVMRSPVSLCTGVTYDRSSIEKWLSLGHNTCPATMQTLPSTTTTPNLTLRRLIRLWLAHADGSPPPPTAKQQLADILRGDFDSDSLIAFMKSSPENLKLVDDAVSRLVERLPAKADDVRNCEMIVEILMILISTDEDNEMERNGTKRLMILNQRRDCLSSLCTVLERGNTASKIRSAKILQLIAVNPESQRKIAEKPGLLHELCVLSTDPSTAESALSALLAISTARAAKKDLIRFGIVRTAGRILSGSDSSSPVVVEKALAVLEAVATCTEGRSAISEDGGCVAEIVKRLMKCSGAATEHGITVLWSVCCLARDGSAQQKVAGVNGLTKVLLVMQSDCSAYARQMCGELVRVLGAKSNLAPYETRTTHIAPY